MFSVDNILFNNRTLALAMKFLIIVPTMNEDIMDKCFESIHPKYHDNLLLIDNSKEGFAHKYGVKYEHHPQNIGISRAWNIGARKVVRENIDYLVVMSATMVFNDGMQGLVEAMEANTNEWGLETQHVWHLICLRKKVFETIGYFDENFYPAYWEDTDFIRRMELANIHVPMAKSPRLPKIEIDAVHQGDALAMKSGLEVNMGAMKNYFIEKWGADNSFASQEDRDKMFKYPFNNPKNNIDYWEENTIKDLIKGYRLKTK